MSKNSHTRIQGIAKDDDGFPHIVDNLKKEKVAKRKKFCYYNG
jgi:hypothetical protein